MPFPRAGGRKANQIQGRPEVHRLHRYYNSACGVALAVVAHGSVCGVALNYVALLGCVVTLRYFTDSTVQYSQFCLSAPRLLWAPCIGNYFSAKTSRNTETSFKGNRQPLATLCTRGWLYAWLVPQSKILLIAEAGSKISYMQSPDPLVLHSSNLTAVTHTLTTHTAYLDEGLLGTVKRRQPCLSPRPEGSRHGGSRVGGVFVFVIATARRGSVGEDLCTTVAVLPSRCCTSRSSGVAVERKPSEALHRTRPLVPRCYAGA